ncbi:hypothetical protein [Staphylococcus haemolyticus]|uniref:hypothetical protein n=1 Tax=Staphylococcus haemolyticus TaxID=1283 RepID=UPI00066DE60A|nr:hypothetical protein [Staphylococcus haemolyticus]TJX95175.1 hypothetical protein FAF35_11235 [Staphylococcus haemolyticus]
MTEKSKEKILEYIKNNHLDYDGVFGELVDASESSVDLLWRLALDFYSPLQTHTSIVMSKEEMIIHELFKQCKSFKKQRDELINDMAEVKRKAEAFDEILNVDYIVTPDDYAHEITKIVDKYKEVNN